MIRVLFAVGSIAYFSSALDPCNLDLPGYDGGEDAASTSDDATTGPVTIGTECTSIVTEFCQQATGRCAMQGFTTSDCVSNDMSQCCASGVTCTQTSPDTTAEISQCIADIDATDCSNIASSTLPSSCTPLLHP